MTNDEHAMKAAILAREQAEDWGVTDKTSIRMSCRAYHKAMLAEAAPAVSVSVAERVAVLLKEADAVYQKVSDAQKDLRVLHFKMLAHYAQASELLQQARKLEASE